MHRFPLVAAACLASSACAHGHAHRVATGVPLIAVLAPAGGDEDTTQSLVDGTIDDDGWYCAVSRPPQAFEVMAADGESRAITAVGFVAGNLGPDGVGPVRVRVQSGHGAIARGQTFAADVTARAGELVVVELPAPVQGDHAVLRWMRGSAWRTAACVGEITVYDAAHPVPAQAVRVAGVAEAEPPALPTASTAPGDAATTTDAAPVP